MIPAIRLLREPRSGRPARTAQGVLLFVLGMGLRTATVVDAGSNGMAMTPPLTWRSWNQMGWYITDAVLLQAADGLVDTSRPIHGQPAGSH